MNLLIKQARIVDPSSALNGQLADIFIEKGIISEISSEIDLKNARVIQAKGLHASPGWVDLFSDFSDPGFEFKETIETGAAAAAAGGFTDVFLIPNTKPVIQDKSGVEYIRQKSKNLPVVLHPIGAITRNTEGKELAEMLDMKWGGAIAFSDGLHCVQSAGIMLKALQYIKAFDGILIQIPDDRSLNTAGLMNEGIISTRLGLQGIPSISEELILARDIKLAEYAGSKVHFTGVSTANSVNQIQSAKKNGIGVSCSVTPYHLFFSDDDLAEYDTNLKVMPPLRTRHEKDFLQQAILEGSVDCIASHHMPQDTDSKKTEFEYARFGMSGLETAYAVLNTSVPGISQQRCVELLAIKPRQIFGLDPARIQPGLRACITLFQPATRWTVGSFYSKSANSPFIGMELTGKPTGIINGEQFFFN